MKALYAVLAMVLLAGTLASCDSPLPICGEGRIINPEIWSPRRHGVVSTLRPKVEWLYLDPTCVPEFYTIKLTRLTYNPYTFEQGGELIAEEDVSGYSEAWRVSFDLEPMQEYAYEVWVEGESGFYGDFQTFFTGPVCRSKGMTPPRLNAPVPGVYRLGEPGSIIFEWAYTNECMPEGYTLQVSSDPSFSEDATFFFERIFEIPWQYDIIYTSVTEIPACQTYYWRVAPRLGTATSGEEGTFSEASHFFLSGAGCPFLEIDTVPMVEPVFFWLDVVAYCRSGPSTLYEVVTIVPEGARVLVEGRNTDSTWFYGRVSEENACWISGTLGRLEGDANTLVEIPPPARPLPTQTPTQAPFDCSVYNTDPVGCASSPFCQWDADVPPNGVCVNK